MYARIPFFPHIFILRDSPERIDYHVRHDDYFAFLATLMGVLEEALKKCDCDAVTDSERELARELRRDLRFVQANYSITPRSLGDIQLIPRKGNLAKPWR